MNIIDHTQRYDGQKLRKYLLEAIQYVPENDLNNIGIINIYDSCPTNYPVIAQGAFWPATFDKTGAIDIFLDQVFGHMLTYQKNEGFLKTVTNEIFIRTFGKLHLADTLFHEIGHHVYEYSKNNKKKSEQFADNYALKIYSKMHPIISRRYQFFNSIYHLLYSSRLEHDNRVREETGRNKKGNRYLA